MKLFDHPRILFLIVLPLIVSIAIVGGVYYLLGGREAVIVAMVLTIVGAAIRSRWYHMLFSQKEKNSSV